MYSPFHLNDNIPIRLLTIAFGIDRSFGNIPTWVLGNLNVKFHAAFMINKTAGRVQTQEHTSQVQQTYQN